MFETLYSRDDVTLIKYFVAGNKLSMTHDDELTKICFTAMDGDSTSDAVTCEN